MLKVRKILITTVIAVGILVSGLPNVFAASETATVTAGSLNVRKGASTTYAVVASVYKGEKVTVLSKSNGWCKISYSGKTGYVSGSYLKFASSSKSTSSVSTALPANITLRRGDNNNNVKVLQDNLKQLGLFTSSSTGLYGSITEKAVKNFQAKYGLAADGIAGPKTISKLNSVISGKSSTTATTTVLSNAATVTGRTDITLRLGSSNKEVTNLQKALKAQGYFKTTPTGYYGSITRSAVLAFQKAKGLTADGIAGPKTLSALYNKSASVALSQSSASKTVNKAKIELSDWFTVMSKVFARGDTATVTDVKTGTTFKVKRYGGTNHADCEPLTAADTAKMQSVYKQWSWTRRPIIVSVDGRRFAASMNGMPHGTSSLPYNNFNGHFCIHTLNSRTHGTDRVDPDHKAAWEYAFKNGK